MSPHRGMRCAPNRAVSRNVNLALKPLCEAESRSGRRGRRFKSCHPDHYSNENELYIFYLSKTSHLAFKVEG
jgi:hypothetical protein